MRRNLVTLLRTFLRFRETRKYKISNWVSTGFMFIEFSYSHPSPLIKHKKASHGMKFNRIFLFDNFFPRISTSKKYNQINFQLFLENQLLWLHENVLFCHKFQDSQKWNVRAGIWYSKIGKWNLRRELGFGFLENLSSSGILLKNLSIKLWNPKLIAFQPTPSNPTHYSLEISNKNVSFAIIHNYNIIEKVFHCLAYILFLLRSD